MTNMTVVDNLRSKLYRASKLDFDRRWKQWAKHIDQVDMSKSDGYAFIGGFVDEGPVQLDLFRPRLFLVASETGSQRYRGYKFRVVRLNTDGTAEDTGIGTSGGGGWALKIRDRVNALLDEIAGTERLESIEISVSTAQRLRIMADGRGTSVADLIVSMLDREATNA